MKKLYDGLKIILLLLLIVAAVGGITYLAKTSTEKTDTKDKVFVGYTVYFDANGGNITGKESLQTDENGKLTELSSKPSRKGMEFVCWSYDPELPYAISLDTVFYRDTVVYAFWVPTAEPDLTPGPVPAPKSYKITFDPNGGELTGTATMLTNDEDGRLSKLPTDPVRADYEFLGWSKGTTSFQKITTYTVFLYDVTVYAWWQELDSEPAIYTITFDPNGGELTGTATMQTNEHSKLVSLPSNPVRGVYFEFKGWSLSLADFVKVTSVTVFTSDTTVYAWWEVLEPDIYTITFDPNGGTLTDVGQMDTKITGKLSYLPTAPTRTDYEFKGWSKSASAFNEVTTDTVFSSNATVYAWWADLDPIDFDDIPFAVYKSAVDGGFGYGGLANGNMLGNTNKYLSLEYATYSSMAFAIDFSGFCDRLANLDSCPPEFVDWLCRYAELMSEFDMYSSDEQLAKTAELEAELLSYNIIMPISLAGGNYVESKIDFNSMIATNEVISADMHEQLNTLYNTCENKSEYKEQAKALLEENGYSFADEITLAYTQELSTWDIHNNPTENDLCILRNVYARNLFDPKAPDESGVIELVEFDDGGMSVILHIREGLEWTNYQGTVIASFVADDFVAGVQHALDCGNRNGIFGVIEGAAEYYYGDITDFNDVGIHAWDNFTLELSFVRPVTYEQLVYMLNTYSGYTPLCRSYYESQGGKFGEYCDPTNSDYTYGKDCNCIAYMKYLCANATALNSVVFNISPVYFDCDNVDIKTIHYVFRRAEDIPYDDTLSFRDLGTQDVTGNENAAIYGLGDYSLMLVFSGLAAEPDDGWDYQDRRTNDLLRLDAVRAMITRALLRENIISQFNSVGGLASITNILSKPNYAATEDEITIDIAGQSYFWESGVLYEALVDMFLNKSLKNIGDPTTGSALYFDGWHDDTAAQNYYDAACAAAAIGYQVSVVEPIYIKLGIVGDELDDGYAKNVSFAIKNALASVNVYVDVVFADASADISQFDIALCYCRTPKELQF